MASKSLLAVVALTLLAAGCGSSDDASESAAPAASDTTATETADAAPSEERAPVSSDPCSVLDDAPIEYDAAGKPVVFTFQYPGGWQLDELFTGSASSIDVTRDVDGDEFPDYVLRFGHSPVKPQENVDNLVAVWRQLPTTEELTEVEIEGRTMYLVKSRIGEMTGYQALFPDVTSGSRAFLVSGGVTDAPEPCGEQAVEAVERILRSMKPNPKIGPPPVN